MHNVKEFVMCLIAGILMIAVGTTGGLGIFTFLQSVEEIPSLAAIVPIINIILYVVIFIANLGGIGAIIGGYLMTTNRVGTGKFIVGIAAGMGIIGLLILLGQTIYSSGIQGVVDLLGLISQSAGWCGVILSIIARRKAEEPE